jgi:hypothetical protein
MLAAAALIAAVGRVGGPWPNARAMVPGPDGVAAAYGYPLRCVSVTTAGPDRAYARVDLDRAAACGRFGWAATAIFHRSDGAWRRVLDASSYTCPAVAVPQAVQAELSVCP